MFVIIHHTSLNGYPIPILFPILFMPSLYSTFHNSKNLVLHVPSHRLRERAAFLLCFGLNLSFRLGGFGYSMLGGQLKQRGVLTGTLCQLAQEFPFGSDFFQNVVISGNYVAE